MASTLEVIGMDLLVSFNKPYAIQQQSEKKLLDLTQKKDYKGGIVIKSYDALGKKLTSKESPKAD